MNWFDEIAAAFPKARDDEPPDLRARIVKELRDHLDCAYRGELLKCGNEAEAEQRVLARFGDPKRLARKLWLDAMQERIMSQRVLMFWSGLMAAVCVAMGVLFWRIVEQSAESNRAFIASMQEANRDLLEQGRAFNLALLERLDRRPNNGEGGAATQKMPEQAAEKAAGGKSEKRTHLSLRLVQDVAGGKPAAGYSVSLREVGRSDADGKFDAGLVLPDTYTASVSTPWGEFANAEVEVPPGKAEVTVEIICPGPPPEFEVSLDVDWPPDLRGHNVGLLIRRREFPREIAGRVWQSSEQRYMDSGNTLVTTRGVVLMRDGDWVRAGAGEREEFVPIALTPEGVVVRPGSTVRWNGTTGSVHVEGIVIFEETPDYAAIFASSSCPRAGDSTDIEAKFEPGQPNPRISIPISPALAANARSALQAKGRKKIPEEEDPNAPPDAHPDRLYSGARMVRRSGFAHEYGNEGNGLRKGRGSRKGVRFVYQGNSNGPEVF